MENRFKLPTGLRALESPRYRRYFLGQAISILGTWVQTVAMSWLVYRLTGSAALLGVTAFLAQAPQLVISPMAGLFIDRFDRKRLFLMVQVVMISQAALLTILVGFDLIQSWQLVALAAVFGLANSFDTPMRQTLLSQLVDDPAHLRNAIALNASLFNSARFVGPPLAGLILALTSESVCFAINAVSFLGVVVAVAGIPTRPPANPGGSLLQALKEGVRYALDSVPIRTLLIGVGILNLTASSYLVVMPVVAKDVFAGDARTLGLLLGTAGGGALLATVLVGSRPSIAALVRLVTGSWLLSAIALALFAAAPALWLALPAAFGLGVGISAVNISTNSILQSITPDRIRGRVVSYFTAFRFGMDALGGLAAGTLTAAWHVTGVLGLEAVLVAAGALWMLRCSRSVIAAVAIHDNPNRRVQA